IRNKDWKLFTPTDPKDYHDEKEIGEIKKTTTNDLWFRNLYATKLEEGTTVYSGDRDYRKGDAPFHITIEEDGEVMCYEKETKVREIKTGYYGNRNERKGDAPFHIRIEEDGEVVFYEKLKKDEDKEEGDPDENDEEIQDYANKKLHKMDDGLKVTNANIINEHINIDVTSDYDEDLADGADMKTIKHTAIVNGIGIGNMIGQLFYMSDEYEWVTLSINIDELGKIDINRQLYVGMDDKIEDANGFYTEFALEEELA